MSLIFAGRQAENGTRSSLGVRLVWAIPLLAALATGCPPDSFEPTGTTAPASDLDQDGFSIAEGDCNDADPLTYPGALDVVGDDTDQNCDSLDGVDADDDEQASMASGGADCNDNDNTIYKNAPEIGWDGIDQNCDKVDQYDFDEIVGGEFHTCGLDTMGLIRCWGGDDDGQVGARPLDMGWKHICAGRRFNCATHTDGRLACWGDNYGDGEELTKQVSDAPTDIVGWDQVACGYDWACALDLQGRATCWGSDDHEQVSRAPKQIDLISITAGHDHGCAIDRAFMKLVCWGRDDDTRDLQSSVLALNAVQVNEYDPKFNRVVAGKDHTCAIRQDLGLKCWGVSTDPFFQTEPDTDAGPYTSLASRENFSCGSLEATALTCWGENTFAQISDAPVFTQTIRAVGTGFDHACGIRKDDGEVVCWGRDLEGQTDVPIWGP